MPTDAAENWDDVGTGAWTGIAWGHGGWQTNNALDPYLVWADTTAFAGLGGLPAPGEFVPVLIETLLPVWLFAWLVELNPGTFGGLIKLPASARSPVPGASGVRFSSALVSRRFMVLYAAGDFSLTMSIIRFQLALPVYPKSVPATMVGTSPLILRITPRVVVGVIDDGLAFANAAVTDRIAYFWNQDDNRAGNYAPPGSAYGGGAGYGSEYGPVFYGPPASIPRPKQSRMEQWISAARSGGLGPPDEEAVYQLAGMTRLRRRVTHGTATMEIACRDVDDCGIVCVQLPADTTKDTSGASLGAYALDGLHYLLARSEDLRTTGSGPLPVVANLSYGNIAGPHDGTSMLERAVDDLVSACNDPLTGRNAPFAVVIPSGNFFASGCHASVNLNASNQRSKELAWRVHPDDRTQSFLEIWLPEQHAGQGVSLAVAPPNQAFGPSLTIGGALSWKDSGGKVLCTVQFPVKPVDSKKRKLILVTLEPTGGLVSGPFAPAGRWRVRIRSTADIAGIDAWIQRDDAPYGYPRRGRQSVFEDADYARQDRHGFPPQNDTDRGIEGDPANGYVRRLGTMNAIATGAGALVVGGYRKSDLKPARYTSSDLKTPPLCAGVSEDSAGHHGVLTVGTHSGSGVPFSGTSVSAPQLTAALARIWSKNSGSVALNVNLFTIQGPPRIRLAPDAGGAPVSSKGPVRIYPPLPVADPRLGYGLIDPMERRFKLARLESDRP